MVGNNIKASDLWRLQKLLELLNGRLGEEQGGGITQKDMANEEEVKALLPPGINGPCWIGQSMRICHIPKVRTRNGIKYNITKQAIHEALEAIRATQAQQPKAANGTGEGDIETTGGGES